MLHPSASENTNFKVLNSQISYPNIERLHTDQEEYMTKQSQKQCIPSLATSNSRSFVKNHYSTKKSRQPKTARISHITPRKSSVSPNYDPYRRTQKKSLSSSKLSSSRKQSFVSKHNLSTNQTKDVLNSDLIYPESNQRASPSPPSYSQKAQEDRRINKVMLGSGNGLGKLLASSLLSSSCNEKPKTKQKNQLRDEQQQLILVQSVKKIHNSNGRNEMVNHFSDRNLSNQNSISTIQHQDSRKTTLSSSKLKGKRVSSSGKRATNKRNHTPGVSPSSSKHSCAACIAVQQSIDSQTKQKSEIYKTPKLSKGTKKQMITQQKICNAYLKKNAGVKDQRKILDIQRKEQSELQLNERKTMKKANPPLVLDINQQLTPQSPLHQQNNIIGSQRFINIEENYETAQFSPEEIAQQEDHRINNNIHVPKFYNKQTQQRYQNSITPSKPRDIKKKTTEENLVQLIEQTQSPIISSTLRSISPFSNQKQYNSKSSGSGYVSARQLTDSNYKPNDKGYRVTDTLRKYEQALVHLEKENKSINSALMNKIEEGIQRSDQVLKLKAKNLELLRKLRIKKQSKQRYNNNDQSPTVPNYLYSNPVKVMKYLKKTYGNGLTMRSSNSNFKSRQSPPRHHNHTPLKKQDDTGFEQKRFSVGNLQQMMSLSARPTNFQTYLAMKKYSLADISSQEPMKKKKKQIVSQFEQDSSLAQTSKILSNSEINSKNEVKQQQQQTFKDRSLNVKSSRKQPQPGKVFSEATKKQVIKARNAASNFKHQLVLPEKHEIVLI